MPIPSELLFDPFTKDLPMTNTTDSGVGPSLTPQSDTVRVLGQTGQTVIYMFPDGRGIAERQQPDFEAMIATSVNAAGPEEETLEDLMATGKITSAQKAVILHDQAMTEMSLDEILIARGWL
jgi:hypothetical protein